MCLLSPLTHHSCRALFCFPSFLPSFFALSRFLLCGLSELVFSDIGGYIIWDTCTSMQCMGGYFYLYFSFLVIKRGSVPHFRGFKPATDPTKINTCTLYSMPRVCIPGIQPKNKKKAKKKREKKSNQKINHQSIISSSIIIMINNEPF